MGEEPVQIRRYVGWVNVAESTVKRRNAEEHDLALQPVRRTMEIRDG